MSFRKITQAELEGKGNLGRPDTPGVTTAEMQRILDELPREVIVPAVNELAGQLEADTAAASLGAAVPGAGELPEDTPRTVQGVLAALLGHIKAHMLRADNPHGVTAAQAGAYTKAETQAVVDQKIVQLGTGDMAQAVYDPQHRETDVFAAVDTAMTAAIELARTHTYMATLPVEGWTQQADGSYTQTADCAGMTAAVVIWDWRGEASGIADTDLAVQEALGYILRIDSGAGTVTVVCGDTCPEVPLSLAMLEV